VEGVWFVSASFFVLCNSVVFSLALLALNGAEWFISDDDVRWNHRLLVNLDGKENVLLD